MADVTTKAVQPQGSIGSNPQRSFKDTLLKIAEMRELNLIIIIIVFGAFLAFSSPYFLTWTNIKVVLGGLSTDGIMVIGMTIILISGGIDLSIGSVMCLAMAICAKLFIAGWNPWLAALAALFGAMIIGWIIGMLVTKIKLTHFITTLCFMGIARGLVLAISGGTPISVVAILADEKAFKSLGQGLVFNFLPMQVIIFLLLVLVSDFLVRKSSMMRLVFYTGSNEKAAEYSGIRVNRVKIAACVICSLCAGIAGIIYLTKFSGVPMSAGSGAEMIAISSAVIGGCSMNGGKGTIFGSVLGLTLMALVTNAMTLFTVAPFWQDLIRYSILLLAVVLDHLQQNAQKKKSS